MLTIRRLVLCLGLLCFIPFFLPAREQNAIPNGAEDRFTLGLPESPWLIVYSTKTEAKANDGMSYSFSNGTKIEFLAWSWLFAIAGFLLIKLSRCIRTPNRSNMETEK